MNEPMSRDHRYTWALCALLAAALFKLWILPLRSSFWVDEMVTAFVVRFAVDLSQPGLRVPFTADARLFAEAATLGREVIWLHC